MARTESMPFSTENLKTKIKGLSREELVEAELREKCWDQIYRPSTPVTFRPKRYKNSVDWTILEQTFINKNSSNDIEETEETKETARIDMVPRWWDWVGGIYSVKIPVGGLPDGEIRDVDIEILLCLDFSDRAAFGVEGILNWVITPTPKEDAVIAYPGVHQGSFERYDICSIKWEVPLLSQHVSVKIPERRLYKERLDFKPVECTMSLYSTPEESVDLSMTTGSVTILQELLLVLGRLLVYGPSYKNIKDESWNNGWSEASARLVEGDYAVLATAFFSRAYCCARLKDDKDRAITEEERRLTEGAFNILLKNYNILQEPLWLETSPNDWVDLFRAKVKDVKTVGDWRTFENEWATVVSYACKLRLHEGPWAGKDWRLFVATCIS